MTDDSTNGVRFVRPRVGYHRGGIAEGLGGNAGVRADDTAMARTTTRRVVALVGELVATPSPNLPGDERAVVAVVLAHMKRLGLVDVQIAAKEPHRPNVIYRLRGQQPGPVLMLCGHSDTKPVGDATHWQTDPFQPVVRDGKLFGLGSTDMKGAVAAMIYATAALKQCEIPLAGDVLLVINADEERSMRFGSEFLSTEYGLRGRGLVGRAVGNRRTGIRVPASTVAWHLVFHDPSLRIADA